MAGVEVGQKVGKALTAISVEVMIGVMMGVGRISVTVGATLTAVAVAKGSTSTGVSLGGETALSGEAATVASPSRLMTRVQPTIEAMISTMIKKLIVLTGRC
jgi:hypothetical protein